MRRLWSWLRRVLSPPKPPTWVYVWEVGEDRVFEWSAGMAVETVNGRGYVTDVDYQRGRLRIGVW